MELAFHKTKQKRSINKASIGNFIFLQKILMEISIKKCAYGGESVDNYDILKYIKTQ